MARSQLTCRNSSPALQMEEVLDARVWSSVSAIMSMLRISNVSHPESTPAQDFLREVRHHAYGTILADPPWQFTNRTGKGGGGSPEPWWVSPQAVGLEIPCTEPSRVLY